MASPSKEKRAYAAAHFALELDGDKKVGLIKSVEGGTFKTDLIKYQNGREHPTFLRLGRSKCEDIKAQVGMAMSRTFYDWMARFFRGDPVRKTGAILAADFWYEERARRDFYEAMITEVSFPKLDGSDSGACYMGVTLSPESIEYKPGDGSKLQVGGGRKQKLWAACNFSFSIDGFETDCARVIKVDGFAIKQKPIEYNHGGLRTTIKVPGRVEYPNIVFYVPEADAGKFVEHHVRYGIGGDVQPNTRLNGRIACHDAGGTDVFEVTFSGGEIFNVSHEKSDAGSEEIKQVKVELSIEGMTFGYNDTGSGPD
jgi:hypothetical protein